MDRLNVSKGPRGDPPRHEPPERPFLTLPDYLAPGIRLVFVGINPGVYSAQRGRYFARPGNRFWPAFSRSRLSQPVRAALGRARLVPEDDGGLLAFGIGFTDVVKRVTANASVLKPADYEREAPRLLERLTRYQPEVACFHGVTGYRAFARYALDIPRRDGGLGLQAESVGPTRLFVAPNPSAANVHFRLEDQVAWYDRLAEYLDSSSWTLSSATRPP